MTSKLDKLKAAFKNDTNQNDRAPKDNNYFNFWNMPFDKTAIVRFIPDKNSDNPRMFLVEKHHHNLVINGQRRKVACLKQYGEDCPICKVSNQFYKEGNEDDGLKYYKKKSYLGQCLVVQDPLPVNSETGESHEGKLRFISITPQIFKVIQEAFESDDLDEAPYEFDGGYNFVIKKTSQGDNANYVVGTKFQNKQSSLTEEQVAYVEENYVDLKTLLPQKPSLEKVEAMLQAALTGQEYVEARKPTTNSGSTNIAEQLASAMDHSKDDSGVKLEDSAPTSVSKEESEALDILAKLKKRKAANAVSSGDDK